MTSEPNAALAAGNEAATTRSAISQAPLLTTASATRAGNQWAARLARYAPVVLPAAVMTVAGLWGLTRQQSMGNDEVATHWAASLSLPDLAHLLNHVDAVHGLYYLLMHGWFAIGSSPTALRVPSVIATVVAVALVAVLARRLTGSGWVALFAGLIMALNPQISYYAQTARSYALVLACVLAATLVLVNALDAEARLDSHDDERPQRVRRWWVGYAVLVALASYLNEMVLLVLAAHAVTVLLVRPRRPAVLRWLTAAVVGTLLVAPLILFSVKERAALDWITRPGLADVTELYHVYFGAASIGVVVLGCAVIAVLPARGWMQSADMYAAWQRGRVTLPSVAVPLVVIPAGLLLVESEIFTPLYAGRYVLYGAAGVALLAGSGAHRVGQWVVARLSDPSLAPRLVAVPGVVVCILALVLQLGPDRYVRTPESRLFDFGGPSFYIGAHAHRGDGVLYFGTFYRRTELGYPQQFAKLTDFADEVTPTRAGDFQGTNKSYWQTLPLMLGYNRIWVVGDPLAAWSQLHAGPSRAESRTLLRRFRLVNHRRFHGLRDIAVTLWVRR